MTAQNPYVLLVEDDEDIREALIDVAVHSNFTLKTADCGQAGLDFLEANKESLPSLILLDMMLPDMVGSEIVRCLRFEPNSIYHKIPIVIMSAAGLPAEQFASLVEGYIRKPIDIEVLIATVTRFTTSTN